MNNPATFGMKWLEMHCSFCPCKKGILPLMQASFQSGFLRIKTIAIAKCGNVQCPSTSTRVILPSALCPRRHPVWCLNPPSRAFWWYTLWIHNLPHRISFIAMAASISSREICPWYQSVLTPTQKANFWGGEIMLFCISKWRLIISPELQIVNNFTCWGGGSRVYPVMMWMCYNCHMGPWLVHESMRNQRRHHQTSGNAVPVELSKVYGRFCCMSEE